MAHARTNGEGADVSAHHAWLLALARRLALDESQAEDLAQGAWADLARRGTERGKSAVRDLRAFLAGVVRVLASRERVAARARGEREARAARAEELPSTSVLVERLELARILAEELGRLPEAQRTLLLLHHQEGVPLATIARRQGLPAGTVRAGIVRARQALRIELDRRFRDRRDTQREGWAALALPRTPKPWNPVREAILAGGTWMSLTAKLGLGAAALGAAVWFGPRLSTGSMPPSGEPPAPALALAPVVPNDNPESARQDSADRTPALGVAPVSSSESLRIQVRDSHDDAALAHFALRVTSEANAASEILASDAAGELALDLRALPPPLTLLALDDPEEPLEAAESRHLAASELPRDGEPLTLAFHAGPSYTFVFPEPPPAGAEIELCLRPGLEPNLGFGYRGRLRAGTPPWARLDPAAARAGELGAGPWTLTARARDGFWLAWGEVRRIEGVQDEPVVLAGGARGVLFVSVTIGGASIESILSARLHRLLDGEPEADWLRRLTLYPSSQPGFPGSGGHGSIPCIEPGVYRLRIGSATFPDHEEDVRIEAGERAEVRFDFAARPELLPLEVILRSQTGTLPLLGLGIAARSANGTPSWARMAETRADGSVRYRFEGLPPGDWEIELDPTPYLPPWDRSHAHARTGDAPLEFLCLDEGTPPRVRRRLRVVDAGNGAPIEAAGIRTFLEHQQHLSTLTDAAGLARIGPYAEGARVEVHARAGGYAGALVELDMQDESVEPYTIALERGWGALFEVVAYDGVREVPLAGVELRLDGEPAGTTDAIGRVLAATDTRPARVELVREGYQVAYGDLDPASGALRAQEQYSYRVTLRRSP